MANRSIRVRPGAACAVLLAIATFTHCGGRASADSLLITGGTVIDGSGAKGGRADVRVVGDRIVAVGKLKPKPGERTIDATGLVVAPGFIDAHSHADMNLLGAPTSPLNIRQGITTVVVGQDGESHFPIADWFKRVEDTRVAVNVASFVGHGTVRKRVMGRSSNRASTPEETAKMQELVSGEMKSGAEGLSSGLEYDPGLYAKTEELVALGSTAGKFGGIYISHVRDEGDEALTSFRELIRIAREGRLPAQISHIKLGTKPIRGKAKEVLGMMADSRKSGLDITADVYPYLYWQSTIVVLTLDRHWEDLNVWEKAFEEVGGPAHVLLANYTPNPSWAGKTLVEIAKKTGRTPAQIASEVALKTHGSNASGMESVVVTAMTEEDLRTFLKDPHIMFCTDGAPLGSHPRKAGSFPRILGRYVRDEKLMPLEFAVHKATSLPAHRFGFTDRGLVRPGMKADLTLFNPATVIDTSTVANPSSPPIGIPFVVVNGVVVVSNGEVTGARPGVVLRRNSAR